MNTANHDIYSQEGQGRPIHAPNRVGTGRVDARAALGTKVLAFDRSQPAYVSVTFGVVESRGKFHKDRTIKLVNKGTTRVTYNVKYEGITNMPGASYELDRKSVTINPGRSATVRVRLRIDSSKLRKVGDPTVEKLNLGVPRQFLADESGRVVFTPKSGTKVPLRVAVYAAPKPVADIDVASSLRIKGNTGSAKLRLHGRGLSQGSGDQAYRALVSALELQGTSPKMTDLLADRGLRLRRERHRPWWRPALHRCGVDGAVRSGGRHA